MRAILRAAMGLRGAAMTQRGETETDARSTLPITEIRQLIFSRETLLDAILHSERATNGWLTRDAVQGMILRGGENIRVVINAERADQCKDAEAAIGVEQIAETLIHT